MRTNLTSRFVNRIRVARHMGNFLHMGFGKVGLDETVDGARCVFIKCTISVAYHADQIYDLAGNVI